MEFSKFKAKYKVLSELGVAGLLKFVDLFKEKKNYWETTKQLHIDMFSDVKDKDEIKRFEFEP